MRLPVQLSRHAGQSHVAPSARPANCLQVTCNRSGQEKTIQSSGSSRSRLPGSGGAFSREAAERFHGVRRRTLVAHSASGSISIPQEDPGESRASP